MAARPLLEEVIESSESALSSHKTKTFFKPLQIGRMEKTTLPHQPAVPNNGRSSHTVCHQNLIFS